jgi:SsrA-binding protein
MTDANHNGRIAENRRARHDYSIEERFEAGLVLEGWEVKSLRAGRGSLSESYAILKHNEVWLIGAHISPLLSASTHIVPEAIRTRKILLHRDEISRLIGAVERRGYTLIPLTMYWQHGKIKLDLGLAKGKKDFDKRETEKDRDWQRDKQRLMRQKR